MARSKKNPGIMGIDAGKMVAEKIKELRVSKAELTRKLNRNHQTLISQYLKHPSMQAYLLWELSVALGYDFFAQLSQALLDKHPEVTSGNSSDKATIAALKKELTDTRYERDYLKKMVDILTR